jgi:hypothetical protein
MGAGGHTGAGRRRPRLLAAAVSLVLGALLAAPAAVGAAPGASAKSDRWAGYLGFNEDVVASPHAGIPTHEYLRLVRRIGGDVIRSNLDWRLAEPERDRWDEDWWGRWEALYLMAREAGITPIFIIGSAPSWAQALGLGCASFGECENPPVREMDEQWADYAAEVARRFPGAMIEVWNEPNTRDFWRAGPDPQRFAELQKLAYDAIKSVDPRIPVITGGLLNVRHTNYITGELSTVDFLSAALAADPSIAESADYLGLHPYPSGAAVGAKSRFARSFDDARSALQAFGAESMPIFVTETGVSAIGRIGVKRQARALSRAHRRMVAMPDVTGIVYHRVVQPIGIGGAAREVGYAWLRYGSLPLSPRPVFCLFVEAAGRRYPGC